MKLRFYLIWIAALLPAFLLSQINRSDLLKQFSSTTNDSLFLTLYSKKQYEKFTLQKVAFPQTFSPIDSIIFNTAKKGGIIGPLYLDSAVIYIKVLTIDSAFRMRVGNIWLSPEKRGSDKVEKLAEDILKNIIKTGDFDAARKEYSDDSNPSYDADLGWFFQGAMVPEFEEEVLKHKKGDYFIISTRYGTHIVKSIDNSARDRSKVEYVLLYLKQ